MICLLVGVVSVVKTIYLVKSVDPSIAVVSTARRLYRYRRVQG